MAWKCRKIVGRGPSEIRRKAFEHCERVENLNAALLDIVLGANRAVSLHEEAGIPKLLRGQTTSATIISSISAKSSSRPRSLI